MSNCDIIYAPLKFLGATVLSFNTNLGLGSSESTLNVDLIEDCEDNDSFMPNDGTILVGAPVYFNAGAFLFGGVLTNWTISQGPSGKTFNAKVVDPRQLLENTIVIVDSYVGTPIQTTNYFNVYAGYESEVLNGNCNVFGTSKSSERGMPYRKIIEKLQQMNPTICSPTGYQFTIDFSSFETAGIGSQSIPEYYRVPGPGVTILQLLQDVCDTLGLEFYVNLLPGGIISVGTIDLKSPPPSFSYIIDAYDGVATELSYGQELRNEKTKALIFGEKQHYLSYINEFDYFFGEDIVGDEMVPIVPIGHNESGFWIKKSIQIVNAALFKPLPNNGPYLISELDIRSALSSYESWTLRALDPTTGMEGTLNKAIQENYVECNRAVKDALNQQVFNNGNLNPINRWKRLQDALNNPTAGGAEAVKPKSQADLEAIHQFIQNLGSTYYGKQWISKLNQTVCYYRGENFQEKIFTDIPTNDGGWVDGEMPVLGLEEPELTSFRSDDSRLTCFAVFTTDGNDPNPPESGVIGSSNPSESFSNSTGGTP